DRSGVAAERLEIRLDRAAWRLMPAAAPPAVVWTTQGLTVSPLVLAVANDTAQRVAIAGTWRADGRGALHVTATHVYLDTLQGALERPARYGGVLDLDATLSGTRAAPESDGQLTVPDGRVWRFSLERRLGGV